MPGHDPAYRQIVLNRSMNRITAEIRLIGWTIALMALFAGQATAAEPDWATGPALKRQLAEPVDIYWSNNPLRRAFDSISQAKRTAILIDRRIDPGQKLSVSLKGVPLESALQQIAASRGLELSRLDNVLYLGPAASADRLRAAKAELTADIRQMPKEMQRKLFLRKAIAWDDLSAPRELVERLARENGLKIDRLNLIPHDLWAAADLPPLTLADRLTLIAFQFDLTLKPGTDGKQLDLTPLTVKTAVRPEAKIGVGKSPVQPDKPADARPVDLENLRIDRLVIREKPLGAILEHLAKRLGFELRIDREAIAAAGISLDQRVSIKVENATIDEFLGKLLGDTRLTYHRKGQVVKIMPAK